MMMMVTMLLLWVWVVDNGDADDAGDAGDGDDDDGDDDDGDDDDGDDGGCSCASTGHMFDRAGVRGAAGRSSRKTSEIQISNNRWPES